MNKMLQGYDRLTGFGHRVDMTELRKKAREWPSDVLVNRDEIVQKIEQVDSLLDEVEQDRASQPLPNYDNIVTKQETTVNIRQQMGLSGRVTVLFNGQVIAQDLNLSGQGENLKLTLTPGANTLSVIALDMPCSGPLPVTYRIEFANNLYGNDFHLMTVPIGNSRSWTIGLPLITINGNDHPESAKHVENFLDTNTLGNDGIWTIDRENSDQRRINSLGLYRSVEGDDPVFPISQFDLDEVPFAAVEEGGFNAFVRPIPESDNTGSGALFGNLINNYGPENKEILDGHDIQVRAINTNRSKTRLGRANANDTVNGTGGIDYIYGLGGNDTLIGLGSNDVLFGNRGDDLIRGDNGDDDLYGNDGTDTLLGGLGNDELVGGLGKDILTGDAFSIGVDTFVLQKGTKYRGDMITDFQPGIDSVGIKPSEFPDITQFGFRNGVYSDGSTGSWITWENNDMMFIKNFPAYPLGDYIFKDIME